MNRMRNNNDLTMGDKLVIPNAHSPEQIISLFPTNKWEYIIIHHSATPEGNSLAFHKSHLKRGWDRGVGYHFVINNGHSDKPDGFIEVTPRWLKQQDGAHCRASDMNINGVGICLVGNFNEEKVSDKQIASLIYLVHTLKDYYHIPNWNILGHGQVRESSTECPGAKFPWDNLRKAL